jgi:hypothetical protein
MSYSAVQTLIHIIGATGVFGAFTLIHIIAVAGVVVNCGLICLLGPVHRIFPNITPVQTLILIIVLEVRSFFLAKKNSSRSKKIHYQKGCLWKSCCYQLISY